MLIAPRPQSRPSTNVEKWRALVAGQDADYIPGFDDGEWKEPRPDQVLELAAPIFIGTWIVLGLILDRL